MRTALPRLALTSSRNLASASAADASDCPAALWEAFVGLLLEDLARHAYKPLTRVSVRNPAPRSRASRPPACGAARPPPAPLRSLVPPQIAAELASARHDAAIGGDARALEGGAAPSRHRHAPRAPARAPAASSAALVTPAATCGRARYAASPTIATRPHAMRSLSTSKIGCRNGCGVSRTTSSSGGASKARDASRKAAVTSRRGSAAAGCRAHGCARLASVSMSRSSPSAAPADTRRNCSGGGRRAARCRPRDRIADELLVRRQRKHHGVEDRRHGSRSTAPPRRPGRATPHSRHRPACIAGAIRPRTVERKPSAPTRRSPSARRAVGEMRGDPRGVLLDAAQLLAAVVDAAPGNSPAACRNTRSQDVSVCGQAYSPSTPAAAVERAAARHLDAEVALDRSRR